MGAEEEVRAVLRGRARVGVEDVVDAGEHEERAHDLVADAHAQAREGLVAEAEKVGVHLEPVVEQVQVEADAARALEDAEAQRKMNAVLLRAKRAANAFVP